MKFTSPDGRKLLINPNIIQKIVPVNLEKERESLVRLGDIDADETRQLAKVFTIIPGHSNLLSVYVVLDPECADE